jgi:hypothetical protein
MLVCITCFALAILQQVLSSPRDIAPIKHRYSTDKALFAYIEKVL